MNLKLIWNNKRKVLSGVNMVFLYVYIGFSVLTFIMTVIQGYLVSKELERKHPDTVDEFRKKNKQGALEKMFSYIKTFVTCFVPIINISIFYVSLFEAERVKEKALRKMMEDRERF